MTTGIETTFTFRNMEATDALKEHALDKLEKLDKYLVRQQGSASAHIIFKLEGATHRAEVTLNMKGGRFVGTESTNDMYASLDGAFHKIEHQLSRKKERITAHKSEDSVRIPPK